LRLLTHRLNEGKLRDRKGRRDAGLLEENHAVAGTKHPAIANPIRHACARAEVNNIPLAGGVGKIQNLRIEIEEQPPDRVSRRWKVERVAGADVDREPRRNLPVVADEKLGNVRAAAESPAFGCRS